MSQDPLPEIEYFSDALRELIDGVPSDTSAFGVVLGWRIETGGFPDRVVVAAFHPVSRLSMSTPLDRHFSANSEGCNALRQLAEHSGRKAKDPRDMQIVGGFVMTPDYLDLDNRLVLERMLAGWDEIRPAEIPPHLFLISTNPKILAGGPRSLLGSVDRVLKPKERPEARQSWATFTILKILGEWNAAPVALEVPAPPPQATARKFPVVRVDYGVPTPGPTAPDPVQTHGRSAGRWNSAFNRPTRAKACQFDPGLTNHLYALARHHERVEIGGVLIGTRGPGGTRVEAGVFPPQSLSRWNLCEFQSHLLSVIGDATERVAASDGWRLGTLLSVGWVHTHPHLRVFLSGIDKDTFRSWGGLDSAAVAVVIDPFDRYAPMKAWNTSFSQIPVSEPKALGVPAFGREEGMRLRDALVRATDPLGGGWTVVTSQGVVEGGRSFVGPDRSVGDDPPPQEATL